MKIMQKVEITAPIGSYEALQAAIQAGADSCYFGIDKLNMRSLSSKDFYLKDIKKIVKIASKHKLKTYLTLNSIIYDEEQKLIKKILDTAKKEGVSAVIAHDLAVLNYAKKINLPIHISTQANVCNIEAVKFYASYADVIVLARELTLDQIKYITKTIKKEKIKGPSNELIKIELFAHGALCVSISGKCYMSLAQYNSSANRGACLQNCRRKYKVTEENSQKELILDNEYVMSPKDLCTISFLDQLLSSGVSILKIEGRKRSAEYVYTTLKCYKEAMESVINNTYSQEKIDLWLNELKRVYNRGFWQGGYYLGKPIDEWSKASGSLATTTKVYLGKATNYFSKLKVAEFLLHNNSLKLGDKILITGISTGVVECQVTSLHTSKSKESAFKGEFVAIKVPTKIRKNDQLFLIEEK